ncbi:hypothetical protein BMS3Bbin04_01809 [bacterium BMS3Bbin04]|nr:hypothetical protein BMS3Bbin04_01809 [bacterium BMS3Bbin04]
MRRLSATFESHDLASGICFLRAVSPGKLHETAKLVLMR